MSATRITDQLLDAYRQTDYQGRAPVPFPLKIDQPSPPLFQLYKEHRCDCVAFITAYNPFSQKLNAAINAQRHLDLMADLASRSLVFVEGIGVGQDFDWLGKASCLVLGLALEATQVLGHKLNQNAIVRCDQEAKPELVLLR